MAAEPPEVGSFPPQPSQQAQPQEELSAARNDSVANHTGIQLPIDIG